MVVGKGPVHEIEVHIIQAKVLEGGGQAAEHVAGLVHVVPQLAGDKQLVPAHQARGEYPAQRPADLLFIAVDRGAVNVAIAQGNGFFNGVRHLLGGNMVAAKGTQADGGHTGPGVEQLTGHLVRIDAIRGQGKGDLGLHGDLLMWIRVMGRQELNDSR